MEQIRVMTKAELEDRATVLEAILDSGADDIEAEDELCRIYMTLKKMRQLEGEE